MRRTLLLLALPFVGFTASAQLQRIVVQGSGTPQVFTNITDALAAAQDNDKLYFSGGSFAATGDITIDRPLHLIGAGIGPDSSAVTGVTVIAPTGETHVVTAASGSTFTGIRFATTMRYGNGTAEFAPTGITFQRCEFVSQANLGEGSESTFDECLFRHRFYGNNGIAVVTRCIFTFAGNATHQPIGSFGTGGLTMDHCTLIGSRVSNSANSTVTNCIFTRDSAPFWQSNGSTIINNLFVSDVLVSNMTVGAESGNVLNVPVETIFVNETNSNFDWTDDIHLQTSSEGVGMATDGTDVGIYGTNSPYKPGAVPFNPHFRSAAIDAATNANGDLPVNIRLAAQTH